MGISQVINFDLPYFNGYYFKTIIYAYFWRIFHGRYLE